MKPTKKCSVCEKVKKVTSFDGSNVCKRCNAKTGQIVKPHIENDKVLLKARDDILAGVLIRVAEPKEDGVRRTVAIGEIGASEIVYKLGVWLAKNRGEDGHEVKQWNG